MTCRRSIEVRKTTLATRSYLRDRAFISRFEAFPGFRPPRGGEHQVAAGRWLLAIGQTLRAELNAVEQPVSERLAAMLKGLERPPPASATRWPPFMPQKKWPTREA
jgi:hypothetical protein